MNITILGVVLGLLLAVVPVWAFAFLRVKWMKTAVKSLLRMMVQLAIVAVYLFWLWKADSVVLNFIWLLLMSFLASFFIVHKGRLQIGRMLIVVWVCVFAVTTLLSFYLLGLVLQVDNMLAARWFVPMAGLLMAGMTGTLSIALREYFVSLQRFSSAYYYKVGNGLSWFQAVVPFLRRAIGRAFLPSIGQIAVMGVTSLPVILSALLMGGIEPFDAVVATGAVTLAVLCRAVMCLFLIVFLSRRLSIDHRGNLTNKIHRTSQPSK